MESKRLPLFAKRFYELRDEMDMSQDAFAKYLGIARATVGFYENGSRLPDALVLAQICERCGVSSDYLLGLTDVKTPNQDTKAMCERLGLSESAVKVLENHRLSNDALQNIWFNHGINAFLVHPLAVNVFENITHAIFSSTPALKLISGIENDYTNGRCTKEEALRALEDKSLISATSDYEYKCFLATDFFRMALEELAQTDMIRKKVNRLKDIIYLSGGEADGDS